MASAFVFALALGSGLLAAALAFDPYDTGRLALVRQHGTFAKGPRIGNASRVHDEAFDAALIGNSHIMTLSTERLSDRTGLRFVMLAIPGTGVPDQMKVLDAYLDRHSPPKALVIGVDTLYCRDNPDSDTPNPFPDWLYARNPFDYVRGLARMSTLQAIGRRMSLMTGFAKPIRRDGMMDLFEGEDLGASANARRLAGATPEDLSSPPQTQRPGLALLRDRLRRLPATTRVILVLPPLAPQALPLPNTPAEAAWAACKSAVDTLRQAHPETAVVDWHRDSPALAGNFFDATHFYDPVAKLVEADVEQALKSMTGL